MEPTFDAFFDIADFSLNQVDPFINLMKSLTVERPAFLFDLGHDCVDCRYLSVDADLWRFGDGFKYPSVCWSRIIQGGFSSKFYPNFVSLSDIPLDDIA